MLREYGFGAHVIRNIYSYATSLVKSVKENNGKKPTLKRLTARLDYQDARVNLDEGIVKISLRNNWHMLRFKHRKNYINKFKLLKWKEVHVKYWSGRLFISIVFEFDYRPYVPKGLIAIDINLKMVVAFDGCDVKRFRTKFMKALSRKKRTEEIQKRYSRMWRYSRGNP
ncbi:MAG: hypothetical protein QXH99_06215 [Sulfolobales archaeon]